MSKPYTKDTTIYKDTKKCKCLTICQACPNSTYSIGLPSLATITKRHSRIKESDASPSGILNTLLTHTTTINKQDISMTTQMFT